VEAIHRAGDVGGDDRNNTSYCLLTTPNFSAEFPMKMMNFAVTGPGLSG